MAKEEPTERVFEEGLQKIDRLHRKVERLTEVARETNREQGLERGERLRKKAAT